MKNIIIYGLLVIDAIIFLSLMVVFFELYGEITKLCKNIKNNYRYPIKVKCIKNDQKGMNRTYRNGSSSCGSDICFDSGGNTRVHYEVIRPYFKGEVNGKTYTFVRTQDIRQPKCEVGKDYTIYLKDINEVNHKDFYEQNEILEMNALIKKKQRQYLGSIGLCVVFAIFMSLLK